MNQAINLPTDIPSPAVSNPAHRTFIRVASIMTTGLFCAAAQAQIGISSPPTSGPTTVTCTNIELMKQVPCSDSAMFFHEGQALVQSALNAKDFKRLDDLYEQWCTGKDRFPDGRWKLSQYGDALYRNFQVWSAWTKDLGAIKTWQQSRPQSEAALYAEAVYWRAYAWKARGTGYADSVSKEGWDLFRERVTKSEDILAALQAKGFQCPAPYPLRLNVLTDLGAPEEQLTSVYTEAVRKYPEYHNIYFAMARHYEPKWGGTVEQYDRFANQVAEQTKEFEGMGMYARIYWLVDSTRGMPFVNAPSQPPLWSKLKTGYEDLMRLYPSSIHNLGKYAGVACRSSDGELYRKLRSKIVGYEQTAEMLDPVDVCDRRHHWTTVKE